MRLSIIVVVARSRCCLLLLVLLPLLLLLLRLPLLLLLLPATAMCCQCHFKAVHKATQKLYFFGRNSFGACFIIILCVVWCVCKRDESESDRTIDGGLQITYIIKWDGYRNKTKLNRWKLTEAYTLNGCVYMVKRRRHITAQQKMEYYMKISEREMCVCVCQLWWIHYWESGVLGTLSQ